MSGAGLSLRWVIRAPAGAPWTQVPSLRSVRLRAAARAAFEWAAQGRELPGLVVCAEGTGWTAAEHAEVNAAIAAARSARAAYDARRQAWFEAVDAWADTEVLDAVAAAAGNDIRPAPETEPAPATDGPATETGRQAGAEGEGSAEVAAQAPAQAPEAPAAAGEASAPAEADSPSPEGAPAEASAPVEGAALAEAEPPQAEAPEPKAAEAEPAAEVEPNAVEVPEAESVSLEVSSAVEAAPEAADVVPTPEAEPEPEPEPEPLAPRVCTVDAGQPCAVCRLFGGKVSAPHGPPPLLSLADALPQAGAPGEACFVAEGRLLLAASDPLTTALAGAVGLVAFLDGRSGPFDGQLEPGETATAAASPITANALKAWAKLGRTLRLVARFDGPLAVGVPGEGVQATLTQVPGATLRGALAVHLAGPERRFDDALRMAAVDAEAGARFGDLVPGGVDEPFLGPWPLTARSCAADPHHATLDVTFDRLAWLHADSSGAQAAAESRLKRRERCPTCGAPMVQRTGHRGDERPVHTRLSIAGRTEAGPRLVASLAPGAERVAHVSHVSAAALAGVVQLETGGLALGAGRGKGWGGLRGRLRAAPTPPRMAERAEGFRLALRDALRAFGLLSRADHLTSGVVSITLLSSLLTAAETAPFALPGESEWDERSDGSQDLVHALAAAGLKVRGRPLRVRRFEAVAGHDRNGARTPRRAVSAGAVFVFEVAAGDDRALFAALERLEADGVGEGRHQGFGRVVAFDPALWAPPPVSAAVADVAADPEAAAEDPNAEAAEDAGGIEDAVAGHDAGDGEDAGPEDEQPKEEAAMAGEGVRGVERHREGEGALVAAAESALGRCFAGEFGGLRPAPLAFSRLAALAGVASGHAEVANALRGAGAAAEAGWSVGLARAVLEGFEAWPGFAVAAAAGAPVTAAWQRYARYLGQARAHLAAEAQA